MNAAAPQIKPGKAFVDIPAADAIATVVVGRTDAGGEALSADAWDLLGQALNRAGSATGDLVAAADGLRKPPGQPGRTEACMVLVIANPDAVTLREALGDILAKFGLPAAVLAIDPAHQPARPTE